MAVRTIVKVGESFEGMFECRHCELEITATVYAKSSGSARGIGADAEAIAAEKAEMDASALASRTLQFVRCPRCGKKDPAGPGYRIQVTVGSILLGVLGLGLCYLMLALQSAGRETGATELWGSMGFGVFLTLVLYWKWGRAWRSPDRRTVFHGDARRSDA